MELLTTRIYDWSPKGRMDRQDASGKWLKKAKASRDWKPVCTGLSKECDVILLNEQDVIYNTSLESAKNIFINTRRGEVLIFKFINEILPHIRHSINLVIAGEDYTFPDGFDKRFPPFPKDKIGILSGNSYIKNIFVENLDGEIPKAIPIPLGLDPLHGDIYLDQFKEFINTDINLKELKFTNFNKIYKANKYNPHDQWGKRREILKLSRSAWKEYFSFPNKNPTKRIDRKSYLKFLSSNLFTVCYNGGGLDVNPKLWESLIVGTIPIIEEKKPYTNIYLEHNLPVVIVKEFNKETINLKNLEKWRDQYYPQFEDHQKILNKLSLDYWSSFIRQ